MSDIRPDHQCMDENATIVNDRWICNCVKSPNVLHVEPQEFVIQFHDKDSNEIGRLTETSDGQLVFQGDTMESADIFFKAVIELNSKRLKELSPEGIGGDVCLTVNGTQQVATLQGPHKFEIDWKALTIRIVGDPDCG